MKLLIFTFIFSFSLLAQTRPSPDMVGKICGTSCVDDFQMVGIFTNTGMCQNTMSLSCFPFTCDKNKKMCFTKCDLDSQCSTGSICNFKTRKCTPTSYSCSTVWSVIDSSGNEHNCNGYRCLGGACQQQCSAPIDCAPGYSCVNHHCVM